MIGAVRWHRAFCSRLRPRRPSALGRLPSRGKESTERRLDHPTGFSALAVTAARMASDEAPGPHGPCARGCRG